MNFALNNKEALLDALYVLYEQSREDKRENVQRFIELYKPIYEKELEHRMSIQDFKVVHKDAFARGAFGKVTLVKHQGQIYAMKILNKSYLITQIDRSSPMEEKLILSGSHEWLPSLYCSFQDARNLYLVMEYAPGGDLQGLMERRDFRFTEEEARFYIAELTLALESVHRLGYMHRDIKPGNILIGLDGHIKLGDLGSCIAIDTKNPLFMVGTMAYVSPEMCNSEGSDPSKGQAYGIASDWWSVGVVLYELLYGTPPFTGKDIQIQMKLLDPTFNIELDSSISDVANDLIAK
ncbi:kinase-like domain-containing protein [Sporodiniella umbellata]|nr:kinase-like domain-containing protein [Sporodiniella umbellata]